MATKISKKQLPDETVYTVNGKIESSKLNIIDNLIDGGVDKMLSAEQGKVLKSLIPVYYTNIVYTDTNDPNTSTIFDLENPPVTNDDLLKNDVNNLYITPNLTNWIYQTSPAGYVTKPSTNGASNFYVKGTTTDAGASKTSNIKRSGRVGGANAIDPDDFSTKAQTDITELCYACSDETSDLTVGLLLSFRMPFGFNTSSVRISLNTASTLNSLIVDIRMNGTSIFGMPVSIDANELTSLSSAQQFTLIIPTLLDDALITVHTIQIGAGATGKGLKLTLKGKRTQTI